MNALEMINQVKATADQAAQKADEYTGLLGPVKEFIVGTFGENGLLAAYLIVAVLILVVISRLVGIGFKALKFLVLPAIGLAFVVSIMLPYSFITVLPVTATVCSLFLLFKG